jgi:hypothetical protein
MKLFLKIEDLYVKIEVEGIYTREIQFIIHHDLQLSMIGKQLMILIKLSHLKRLIER